ncbi:protocadherin-11 X-linked-like [Mercenaria mercenaria]|uniref:protocadherin-11 X-linked-like n=1 Tax=Mercenaria mercenaria TaxID=6596 RepID=UPI00234E459F|nr:protocadherin-11 X-linked-like [Mercenaria mercenaria]XP_045204975.2 protocadherin-11 X-linked-like [Mercenaria mercenaria]
MRLDRAIRMTSFTETALLIVCIVCCSISSAEDVGNLFSASILENKESGFFIGNLATGTQVLQNATESQKEGARFTYLKESANNIYFTLNLINGDLNTSDMKINREDVCEFSVTCTITLEIAVTSGKFFDIVTAKITILDENDNAPTFSNEVRNLDISEGEAIGTEFRIGTAFDADMSGNNSIQDYAIEQPAELFELIATKGNDNSYSFKLKLLQKLDRETKHKYSVKVTVSDGGNPVQSETLDITVNVLDENDNTPAFSSNGYNQTIDENIHINSVILTIFATDEDTGENGRVSYRIRERQSNIDLIKRLFKLDESSGNLSVISDLTSEPAEYYEFFVEATDHGSTPLVNQTVVTITVNDAENNPPTIEINLLSPGKIGFVDIEENQPTEVFVAHVNVEDYDKGDNGKFSCDIENSLFRLERFQGRGFKVVVDGLLDREDKDIHTVKVECKDLGNPPKTSSETFSVRVLDVNDNDPKFEKEIYNAVIAENNNVGVNITKVKATDNDQGLNGTVEYMLLEPNGYFLINNVTGQIFANKSFDRERESLIIFSVLAVDHGPSRRTATTTVSLTLTDTNDNAPVMIPARPEMRITENQAPNTSLGFLQAKDSDLGVNGMVTFAITHVQQTSFPFTLSRNGELKTTEGLDREKQNRYEIPVTVTDLGAKQLSNTQYVTIYVTDENDNSPKITFPNAENNTVKFIYPVDTYNVVTTVAAYDVDDGENGSLSYQITGGNELGIFEIDSELGEISIKKYIDIKEDMTISLTVDVKDKAVVPRSTNATLKIELIYANSTVGASGGDDTGNKYIIISVVVIVTTIAVAIAIVAVILFLRSVDNKKTREDESARYSDSGISSNADSIAQDGYLSGNAEEKSKKKKEVSFSLEFSLDGLDGGRNMESSTDEYSQNRFYDSPPTTVQHGPPTYNLQNQEKIDGHMKALKLQQYLWEAKSRVWENSPVHQQLPVGDSESETSRDTVTCDSGRGGSEDDVSMSSPVAEEKRFFSIQDPKPKHVQFLPQQKFVHTSLPTVRESTPVHHSRPPRPPRPVSYKPTSQTDLQNNVQRNNPRLAIKNFTNPTYSSNHAHSQNNQRNSHPQSEPWREYYHQNGGKYYPRMRHDSGSSMRSNEDDGGSTTTSGSYTLDENDIDIADIYLNQRDLVV